MDVRSPKNTYILIKKSWTHFRRIFSYPVLIISFIVVINILKPSSNHLVTEDPSGLSSIILNPAYRSLLHISQNHFISNIATMSILLFSLGITVRNKYLIPTYIALFGTSYFTMLIALPNVIGTSIFIRGIYAVVLIFNVYGSIRYYRFTKNAKMNRYELSLLGIAALLMFGSHLLAVLRVAIDMTITAGIEVVGDRPYTKYIISELPSTYGYSSAVGHTVGFVSGLILSVMIISLSLRFNTDPLSEYFSRYL